MSVREIVSLAISTVFMPKSKRIRAHFLDNSDLVKYYPTLMFLIENKKKYEIDMRTLCRVANKEYTREQVKSGLCRMINSDLSGALRDPDILKDYKFWSGSQSCVITVKNEGLCGIEYHSEYMQRGSDEYYEARVELARYWLNVMTFVKNKYDQF
ncbi:hypothetical protein phiAS5_ORF0173 [Aeromonas phage phiAS5]|uniref:Uncharacterized protein n=1 Tax=Aeromonas phage phiAS5 TaxID=879630 RepID=E1A2S0_9CAUD|nr:hypothetical protein phiAS5_ORF0173 [Aeromonas phage phiAS5]ADM80016.1 hypothetical protein phiAS5_ORF0173 [Aeromonas phage phiAS5]